MAAFHRSGSTVLQETGGAAGALTHTPGFAMRGATGDRLTYEDWLGSTRYTTDNNGVQKGGYAFDAFGRKVATAAGSDGQPQDFMWGGGWGYQSEDAASGLVLMGQRYYDPEVGRFLSPDRPPPVRPGGRRAGAGAITWYGSRRVADLAGNRRAACSQPPGPWWGARVGSSHLHGCRLGPAACAKAASSRRTPHGPGRARETPPALPYCTK